jgi:hypothetical protein
MKIIKRRHEHERVKSTKKVRALKHRRSRSTHWRAMTPDNHGKHAHRHAVWRKESRRLRAAKRHAQRRAAALSRASRLADEGLLDLPFRAAGDVHKAYDYWTHDDFYDDHCALKDIERRM